MTSDQAHIIAVKLDNLIASFVDMRTQNEAAHKEVKIELKAINTRLTHVEMWRERIKGAMFSVPVLVSFATSVIGGIILYAFTN